MSSSSSSSSAAPAPAAFPPPLLQQQPESLPLPLPPAAAPAEQLCYVHCHFCDTVLVVSVPGSSLFKTVTVRCGHCSSLLTVNMRGLLFPGGATAAATAPATAPPQPPPPPAAAAHHGHFHLPHSLNLPANPPHHSLLDELSTASNPGLLLDQQNLATLIAGSRSAATPPSATAKGAPKEPPPRTNAVVNRPPEKRQRVPSAYNRFIKDEIQRIKAGNPDISHREAFSAAAKNWAHFPHIHFGLMPDHHSLKKTSLLPQDHQRKDGLLKDGIYAAAAAAAAAAANMGVAPY